MNLRVPPSLLLAASGLTVMTILSAGTASAAGNASSQAQVQYQQDRAKCLRGETNQDRATCLKEAAAALQESRNHSVGTAGDSALARNRLQRCDALPASDRQECAARMNEGVTSGSAQQGGVLRELSSPTK